jgi:hypothetical protein
MTKRIQLLTVLLIAVAVLGLSGCTAKVVNIPPGYVGKVLMPTGWKDGVIESGQVDIGQTDTDGRGNRLVLLEATSVTIKEVFDKANQNNNNEDHRIITMKGNNKMPLAVDIYVQVMVPDDPKMRDSIFAQVTPVPEKDNDRVSKITLEQVYNQFAKMTIRGKTRQIFTGYAGYDDVMLKYEAVSSLVAGMITNTFTVNKVPLKLIAGQLSNVKADETVWKAENDKASAAATASAIEQVGVALRSNPGYLEKYKWDVLKEIAGKQNLTIIVNDGRAGGMSYTLPQQK